MSESRNLWDEYHLKKDGSFSVNLESTDALCITMLSALNAFETAFRQFYPPFLPKVITALEPFESRFLSAWRDLSASEYPSSIKDFTIQLEKAAGFLEKAFLAFSKAGETDNPLTGFLSAFRYHSKAQASLYPLHQLARPVNRYFIEASLRSDIQKWEYKLTQNSDTGLITIKNSSEEGKDHYLYVPEYISPLENRPLVIALHGGYGSGEQFIWCWLREARSRGFILLAPGSQGKTWDLEGTSDQKNLALLIEKTAKKYRVNKIQRLLTGFSDGATFSLQFGLAYPDVISHVSPISGLLHADNLKAVKNKPVYLVHGTLDWMFPVNEAVKAKARLESAGADITFKEIYNLSHSYPREENLNILKWFAPSLSHYF